MKRFLSLALIIVMLAFTISCSTKTREPVQDTPKEAASEKSDITGTWERTGDILNGMQVKVEKQGDAYKATLVKVTEDAKTLGFDTGIEKWRNITKSQDNLWLFKDFGFTKDKKENMYDMSMKLIDNDSVLELSSIVDGKEIGAKQLWKKVQ